MIRAVAPLRNTGCKQVVILIHFHVSDKCRVHAEAIDRKKRFNVDSWGREVGGASGDKLNFNPRLERGSFLVCK